MAERIPELEVLQRKAEWASTFGAAATNLSQRRQYAEDRERYASALEGQREEQMLGELKTNRVAQDLYFKQKNFDRAVIRDEFSMRLKQEDQDFEDQLEPLRLETERHRAGAARALEVRRLNDEARTFRNAQRVEMDSDALNGGMQEMLDRGILPGSKEFATTTAKLAAKHPYATPETRKQWFSQAKIEQDSEEYLAAYNALDEDEKQRATISYGNTGYRFSIKPKGEAAASNVGTITTTTDEDGKVKTSSRRPFTPEVQDEVRRNALLSEHDALEEKINSASGKPQDPATVAQLNSIKAKLGFTPIGSPGATAAQSSAAKALDPDSARNLLKEAGGDKARARQLAKERGFSF